MVAPAARLIAVAFLAAACGGGKPLLRAEGPPLEVTLPSLDGDEVALAQYRGRIVVVHFFTTWAIDAQADLTELRRARAASPALAVVGVALDPEGARLVAPWAAATRVDWTLLLGGAEVTEGHTPFGPIQVVPSTVVLDRSGRVAWRHGGPLPRGALAPVVRALEAAPPSR